MEGLALLRRLVIIVEQLGFHREVGDDIISVAAQQDPLILLVELVQFILDLFAPVQILRRNLPVFVLVVQLHELHDAMRPVQVYQVLILIISHEVAVHREEAHF